MDRYKKVTGVSLRVVYFNCNGLKTHLNEIQVFVTEHDVDVLLVNETHLQNGDRDPVLVGYRCYRGDRLTGPGGGAAVYIKASIEHEFLPLPAFQNMEAAGVKVNNLKLISVYCRPGDLTEADLVLLHNAHDKFLAAGDFNAKHTDWSSRSSNPPGRLLRDFVANNDLTVLAPSEPTYFNYTTGQPDVLDIVLVKDSDLAPILETIDELSSDHVPVLMTFNNMPFTSRSLIRRRTDWIKYTRHLEDNYGNVPVISSARQIEDEVDRLDRQIKEALAASTTKRTIKPNKPVLPKPLLDLIREKKRARRRAHRTNLPEDRREANRLTNDVRYALIDFRNRSWEARVESLSDEKDHTRLWTMARTMKKAKTRFRPLHGTRGIAYSNEDRAETFADHMETTCRPNLGRIDLDHIETVERRANNIPVQRAETFIEPTSPGEVKSIIRTLRTRKAPGPDEISNTALKFFPNKILTVLATICNAIFRFQHYPSQWKCANVIFFQKPGKDGMFPQNYRPISLISNIGKVIECLILVRLTREVEQLKLIPDEQFGFRPGHSTVHQLSRVSETIFRALNFKQFVGAIFLDVSKAFDTVWHEGLIYKLLTSGVSRPMTRLVRSFLRERKIRAKFGDELSSSRQLEAGVPQGSVLSPLLYTIFTADMPKPDGSSLAVYADDTAILSRSMSAARVTSLLQRFADSLEDWFQQWGIDVNPEKSSAILFTRRRSPPVGHVRMFDRDIPWRDEVKYLGLTLDKRLSFVKQVNAAVTKGKQAFGILYPLVGRKSKLSLDNKLLLYKAIARPAMTYGSSVWGNVSNSSLKKLQVVQNKFLRVSFDAPWFVTNVQLHREANIPTIKAFFVNNATKFYGKAEEHSNPLVRAAVDYDESEPSSIPRPRGILLWPP